MAGYIYYPAHAEIYCVLFTNHIRTSGHLRSLNKYIERGNSKLYNSQTIVNDFWMLFKNSLQTKFVHRSVPLLPMLAAIFMEKKLKNPHQKFSSKSPPN